MAHAFDGILNWAPGRLKKSPSLQKLATPLGRKLSPDRWIFIIGCYNSGTTLLKEVLASHPEIQGLPCEGVALTDALPRPEEEGWTRMWHKCYESVRIDPTDTARARRAQQHWSLFFPSGSKNLLEKSIANATRIPFMEAHFQPAYFIYLVRNGYAVAEGIQRKAQPRRWGNPTFDEAYPIELCARQWRCSDEVVSKARSDVDRFMTIRYEEFTADPSAVLDRVTNFLGLPPLPDEVVGQTWGVHGYDEPIRNMNTRSYQRLSEQEVDRIQTEAGDILKKYSYDRPSLKHE